MATRKGRKGGFPPTGAINFRTERGRRQHHCCPRALPSGTTVEPVNAGGVPAEWVIAADVDSARVLLYLHGGAYQVGSPATLRRMIALISAAAQARVLSVDYRLAPEHPFPAAVDDAQTAYRFLLSSDADHGGTDP